MIKRVIFFFAFVFLNLSCSSSLILKPELSYGKYGYVNKEQIFIIPPKFDFAAEFSEGLARVSYNKKFGFIKENGEIISPFEYDIAFDFRNGFAIVGKMSNQKLFYGVINKAGKIVLNIEYEKIIYNDNETIAVKKENKDWEVIRLKSLTK